MMYVVPATKGALSLGHRCGVGPQAVIVMPLPDGAVPLESSLPLIKLVATLFGFNEVEFKNMAAS